jgi:hypothetical protein
MQAVSPDPKTSAELHGAIAAEQKHLLWQRRYRERTIGFKGQAVGLAFASSFMLLTVALAWLVAADVIPDGATDYLIPIVTLTLFFGGLIGILIWQRRAGAADSPAERNVISDFAPSQSLEQEARLLRLANCAEPRIMSAWYAERAIDTNETFWGLVFVGPAALGALAFSAALVMDQTSLSGNDGNMLGALWLVVLLGTGLVAAFRQRRLSRRRRDRETFSQLGAHLGAAVVRDHAGVIGWLNAHWATSSSAEELHAGPEEHAVSAVVNGYPVMLDFEPHGRSDEDVVYPPRLLVYLAALVPDGFADSAVMIGLRRRLSGAGFDLGCFEGAGLLARATPLAISPVIADHGLLVETVPPLVQQMVSAARDGGVVPAPSVADSATPLPLR